jgi:hypothetical protein
VPDFGIDEGGSLVLGHGPRSFTVGFDELLKPYVVDGAGVRKRRCRSRAPKTTPAWPGRGGPIRGVEEGRAHRVGDQIRRLERAMVAGREWTGAEFRALFVDHPLLVRRLVWGTGDGASFRMAEDRTFAGADDDGLCSAHPSPRVTAACCRGCLHFENGETFERRIESAPSRRPGWHPS